MTVSLAARGREDVITKVNRKPPLGVSPYNAEIYLYKSWRSECVFFQFEIIINVLLRFFCFFEYLCYGSESDVYIVRF